MRRGRPRVLSDCLARIIFIWRFRIRAWRWSTASGRVIQLEKDLGLPMVATNDSHYLCEDDAHAQDVMLCIQTGKSIQETNRMKFEGSQSM